MSPLPRLHFTAFTALALAASLLNSPAAQPATAASAAPKPALTVSVVTPQRTDWPQSLAANGNLAAWQEVIISAPTQGLQIVEMPVQIGDRVRKGQLLLRLQSDTLEADLAATQASLAEAQATLTEARANAERAKALQPSGAISIQQAQQAEAAALSAQARLQSLKARLAADTVRLKQTRVLAPDDGVISARQAALGAVAQPGQELLRLIRQNRLEWRAEVPATDMNRLQVGQSVKVTPAGAKAPLDGRVRLLGPTVDPTSRNGLVYVDLPPDASTAGARAGSFARGEFLLGTTQALTLPQTAVQLRDGYSYVLRVGADQRVVQTKVSTGRRVSDRVEITSGLEANTPVVAQGVGFLSDGDVVRVVTAPALPASAGAKP